MCAVAFAPLASGCSSLPISRDYLSPSLPPSAAKPPTLEVRTSVEARVAEPQPMAASQGIHSASQASASPGLREYTITSARATSWRMLARRKGPAKLHRPLATTDQHPAAATLGTPSRTPANSRIAGRMGLDCPRTPQTARRPRAPRATPHAAAASAVVLLRDSPWSHHESEISGHGGERADQCQQFRFLDLSLQPRQPRSSRCDSLLGWFTNDHSAVPLGEPG